MKPISAHKVAIYEARQAAILKSLRKLGAATILDIAADIDSNHETIRRNINALVESGRIEIASPSSRTSRAMFALPEIDEAIEFDIRRLVVPAVQLGMHRDSMIEAFYGQAAHP